MRAFLLWTILFEVATAILYLRLPASEAAQWPNLMLGFYIGAVAMARFGWKRAV